jgi:hypothetical protein
MRPCWHREVFLIGVRRPEYRRLPVACLPVMPPSLERHVFYMLGSQFLETHGAGSSHLSISPLVLQRVVGEEFRDTARVCVRVGRGHLQIRSVF